jgi:glycosyltransferase involved in cell wall biosynthesis
MAFGMPIITRPVGGLSDFFEEGKMGFLCQSKTAKEIAVFLEKIILNRKMMAEMSKYNYKYARENFMASIVAKKLTDTYKALLADLEN